MYKTPYFSLTETKELIDLLTSIFDTSNDGLYVCDKDGFTMLYNEAFLQISGIPKEFMDAYSTIELKQMNVVPESCAGTAIHTGQPYSTIIDYYNGKKGVVSSTPIFDHHRDIHFVVSYIRDITEINRLHKELEETRQTNIQFRKTLEEIQNSSKKEHNFVYRSKRMDQILSTATKLAKNDSPVLLLGESGVGKDVLAHLIHEKSSRKGQLIKINCGAIPEHLLESELFGYEKGAFTGAATPKEGLFETADEGTLFLDEIGDLPYSLQVKLLNVLQDSKIRRLGATQTREVNVRIITATNSDLESFVEQKTFRLDLYYRLNVLSITIPPLRERQEDVPALIFLSLNKLSHKYKVEKRLSNDALEKCLEYSWPGNVREVENIVERMYHMCENNAITADDLPSFIQQAKRETFIEHEPSGLPASPPVSLKKAVYEFEKDYISDMLSRSATLQECADTLGINISTLVRKKKSWET
ncbi:sigma-54 interaction domain-containing protein [Salibacterium aidingense]|uniref:sigma-54 interaction domain-containing protein n=1 Tax=Salibacterium aidingense TaxID=384933 RepID=UPI003BD5AA52